MMRVEAWQCRNCLAINAPFEMRCTLCTVVRFTPAEPDVPVSDICLPPMQHQENPVQSNMLPEQFSTMTATEIAGMAPATAAKYEKTPVALGAITRFPLALQEVAKVSAFGCKKHQVPMGDMSYLDVPDAYAVYTNALSRHLTGEAAEGAINHNDGGLLHAAQAAWNALARLEVLLRAQREADRGNAAA